MKCHKNLSHTSIKETEDADKEFKIISFSFDTGFHGNRKPEMPNFPALKCLSKKWTKVA